MSKILSILEQNKRPLSRRTRELGSRGERIATAFLDSNGYRLVLANFRVPIGRNKKGVAVTGEIDVVALDGDVVCFVEVKTRTSDAFADPIAAVNAKKQRQITRAARVYRRVFGLGEMQYRFDVVSIVLPNGEAPRIELLKGYWSESKFRKRVWTGDIY